MALTEITFIFLPDGTLDCWFQHEGGATTSFDPAQIPAQHQGFLGDLLPAALAAKVAAESKAAAVLAENEAKDATAQELLARIAALQNQNAKMEARLAELGVFEAMAGN